MCIAGKHPLIPIITSQVISLSDFLLQQGSQEMGFRKVRDNEWEEGKNSSGLDRADKESSVWCADQDQQGYVRDFWQEWGEKSMKTRPRLGERAQCVGLKGESGGAGRCGGKFSLRLPLLDKLI